MDVPRRPTLPAALTAAVLAGTTLLSGAAAVAYAGPAAAVTGVKPVLGGLLTRGVPDANQAQYLSGFAVVPDWSQLEPSRGVYDFSFIDSRIATAQHYGLGVRLRVIAGTQAPAWAKSVGGPPVTVYDHQRGVTTTIGRFWTPAYQQAWQELQAALAARYDTDPTVRSVDVAGTGVISAEVSLLMAKDRIPGTSTTNGGALLAAGYTEAAREQALTSDIDFMSTAWPHTRVGVDLAPLETLAGDGRVHATAAGTLAIWDPESAAHPALAGYNTGLSKNVVAGTRPSTCAIYAAMAAQHAVFDVQTVNKAADLGDPAAAMSWAVAHGITSVELPAGKSWTGWGSGLLTSTNAALAANAAGHS